MATHRINVSVMSSMFACDLYEWWNRADQIPAAAFNLLQPASQVTVTSSGRTVKRRFNQLDDDSSQEVPAGYSFHISTQFGLNRLRYQTLLTGIILLLLGSLEPNPVLYIV